MAFAGVLLDIDGTLLLSNDAHGEAWVEAFAQFGYDIAFETVRPMMGMGGDHIIPKLVPGLQQEDGPGKAISDYRKDLVLQKYGPTLQPTPGARELVQKLQNEGLDIVVATSASDRELDLLLEAAQVKDLLDKFTTSDEADASKPRPDIVQAALSKTPFPADQVVMLADTPYDVEAADKAGVKVIALRTGGFSDQELQGAIAIYQDPTDLLQHYDASPLGSPT